MKTLEEHVALICTLPRLTHAYADFQDAIKSAARQAMEAEDQGWRERWTKHDRAQRSLANASRDYQVKEFQEKRPDLKLADEIARKVLERFTGAGATIPPTPKV